MSRSSSGLGRRPLKAEITSSNLVRDVFFCLILHISLLGARSDTSAPVLQPYGASGLWPFSSI